ncbi:unnamed protein product [Sphagnum jensenii]|uniref:Uncharacterized protein n=1 Tax=Sphagnum jensenii TaxID=128206 RepID=A0ABP0VGS6_9BRYO
MSIERPFLSSTRARSSASLFGQLFLVLLFGRSFLLFTDSFLIELFQGRRQFSEQSALVDARLESAVWGGEGIVVESDLLKAEQCLEMSQTGKRGDLVVAEEEALEFLT